jgi:hypothetical protein
MVSIGPARHAGIVAEHVHLAELRQDASCDLGISIAIGHVASKTDRGDSFGLQRLDRLGAGVGLGIGDRDLHAAAAEGARHRQADAAGASGDEHGLAGKILHWLTALSPHPEEPRSGVSKDETKVGASWFETREDALLTMRGRLTPSVAAARPLPPRGCARPSY